MTRRHLSALMLALGAGSAEGATTKKQNEAINAMKKADLAFCEDTKARGLDGWMNWFAEDATAFPPGRDLIHGHAELRAFFSGMFARKDFVIEWAPVQADAAASGDLGYTIGNAKYSWTDKDGKPVTATGTYLSVWKKQKDGSWKVAADLGS
jgi:ketosteroid isomerase-like protein